MIYRQRHFIHNDRGKTNIIDVKKNTGQDTGKGNQYTISENKEPQNSRYLIIIRKAWQRHECK